MLYKLTSLKEAIVCASKSCFGALVAILKI
jgi:hypothetical protein